MPQHLSDETTELLTDYVRVLVRRAVAKAEIPVWVTTGQADKGPVLRTTGETTLTVQCIGSRITKIHLGGIGFQSVHRFTSIGEFQFEARLDFTPDYDHGIDIDPQEVANKSRIEIERWEPAPGSEHPEQSLISLIAHEKKALMTQRLKKSDWEDW